MQIYSSNVLLLDYYNGVTFLPILSCWPPLVNEGDAGGEVGGKDHISLSIVLVDQIHDHFLHDILLSTTTLKSALLSSVVGTGCCCKVRSST